jgi:hypothetical protein
MGQQWLVDEYEIAAASCLSRVRGNLHARFLGEGAAATLLPYPTALGSWSNRKTSVSHAEDPGATPGDST